MFGTHFLIIKISDFFFSHLFSTRSTEADDDDDAEWGWDETPSKSGKITGMKLNNNLSPNLLHRTILMDNTNKSHNMRDIPRRSSSGHSQSSYKDGTVSSMDGIRGNSNNGIGHQYKASTASSVQQNVQVQQSEPNDFFEQMGLSANKPSPSSKVRALSKPTNTTKPLPSILAPKPKIVSPAAAPILKKMNKLGATTIKSDSFDDMADDDWGDDEDLDDLLKE
jgi:hypothetical protein